MSKEIATRGGTDVATEDDNYNPYAQAADEMGGGSNGAFLKFNSKMRAYVYGQEDDILLDDDELEEGKVVRLAVNMEEFKRGWICWIDDEVKEELLALVTDRPIREASLPDYEDEYETDDDGWIEVAQAPMRDIETGEQYLFKAASRGAVKGLGKFLKDFSKQFKRHIGEVPILELDMDSYKHKNKKFGTIFNPVFNLVEFMDPEALLEMVSDDDDGYEPEDEEEEVEEAPKKKAKGKKKDKKKKPDPEPEDEDDEKEVEVEEAPKKKAKGKKKKKAKKPDPEPEDEDEDEDEEPKKRKRRKF